MDLRHWQQPHVHPRGAHRPGPGGEIQGPTCSGRDVSKLKKPHAGCTSTSSGAKIALGASKDELVIGDGLLRKRASGPVQFSANTVRVVLDIKQLQSYNYRIFSLDQPLPHRRGLSPETRSLDEALAADAGQDPEEERKKQGPTCGKPAMEEAQESELGKVKEKPNQASLARQLRAGRPQDRHRSRVMAARTTGATGITGGSGKRT